MGAGLIIIWVCVPILALVLAGSWAMCEFERILAVNLLKEAIPRTIRGRSTVTDDQDLSCGSGYAFPCSARLSMQRACLRDPYSRVQHSQQYV